MVLALLAKRKTQTRRIVKPQTEHRPLGWGTAENGADKALAVKPYARVGDRLWGRETWAVAHQHVPDIGTIQALKDARNGMPWASVVYRASAIGGWAASHLVDDKWRPSIFMPRWASRLLHEVTAVRVERLQDISEADAFHEGIEMVTEFVNTPEFMWPGGDTYFPTAREAYLAGWDSINGKGSAAKNPWVWVVTFRPVA